MKHQDSYSSLIKFLVIQHLLPYELQSRYFYKNLTTGMQKLLFKKGFLLLLLLFIGSIVTAQETYLDNFSSVSYSNNNGTQNFSGNWNEINDNNSPNNGRIRITGNELRFEDISRNNRRIQRSTDLTGAASAILSLDWRTSGLDGSGTVNSEQLDLQISSDGTNFTTIGIFTGSQSDSFSQDISAYISANTTIRLINVSTWQFGDWEGGEYVYIDDVQISATFTPVITIDDISVNENAGTASFTATHVGLNASGPFTVNYQTVNGTALSGTHYTSTTGTLSFNGTSGDTELIAIPILDNSLYDGDKNYSIQFTSVSDVSVNIADTALGTIVDDEVILNDVPLALYREFDGNFDYTTTGGTFRTASNGTDPCAITTTSSNTLNATIPAGATITRAYLYWAHSNFSLDQSVTFEGQNVDAELIYGAPFSVSGYSMNFYGYWADVTSIVSGISNPSTNIFDLTDLNIDNTGDFCTTATVLGAWSLMVFYEEASLPASTINLYYGFDITQNAGTSFTLDSFYAISPLGSKVTFLSYEGDATLDGSSSGSTNPEELSITNQLSTSFILSGDGGQTGNNAYNSTIYDNTAGVNSSNIYGLDLDTWDISTYISTTDTQVTANVDVGQDLVISSAVVLRVPSNLISGTVFEDLNYPGGAGRNLTNSSGVGIEGVTVELYDTLGVLSATTTTDANGDYSFGGMADGTYSVRILNQSTTSNRGGGGICGSCYPVQTFRTSYNGVSIIEVTNEIGGTNPAATADTAAGTLSGAQSVSVIVISGGGIGNIDFGFNFNTIVNTNEDGQGSLEQFIVNSNELDETGLDIEANGIFNPAAGEDVSIFMIPPTGDSLGRPVDANYSGGIFDIETDPLTAIMGDNTHIDGRTQTAYSGNTNTGAVGAGGTTVGIGATALPNYDLPEIQVHDKNRDTFIVAGNATVIRNISVYANNNAAIRVDSGSATISNNLLGVNALGANSGNIDSGVEIIGGTVVIDGNYISTNTNQGIWVNGGTSSMIQNNHISSNGDSACSDNITIQNGSGVTIQQNLIENAASLGIDGDGISGSVTISQNTITNSGQNGGNCAGNIENAGILLDGNNSSITGNIIASNGGPGIVLAGGNTSGNLISQNSIYGNGTTTDALGIDLDISDNVGDGVTLNDNGDSDSGPNGLSNFPIITVAYRQANNLVVKGWARPGATIEFFLTDVNEGTATEGDNELGMSTDYGEGQIYLGTAVEGSGSDLAAGFSSYADVDGNTDNTNLFEFSLPIVSGIAIGDYVTATATISNSTSEFSPFSILKVQTVITNRRITYRVNKN